MKPDGARRWELSPESLLQAAVALSCGIALPGPLRDRSLRSTRVVIHVDESIASEQRKPCVTGVMLKTTIFGADLPRQSA